MIGFSASSLIGLACTRDTYIATQSDGIEETTQPIGTGTTENITPDYTEQEPITPEDSTTQ